VKTISFKSLMHEWLALVAILAMVLGPLALGVSRSLATHKRVAIAAGLSAMPLCQAGDALDATGGPHTLSSCDQCLPGMAGPLPALHTTLSLCITGTERFASVDASNALRAATGLPPATGPPVS
jgi:hypothetical protein